MAEVELKDIDVRLGRRSVLRGVTLVCESPGVLGFFGPNGAGKTTLFRTLLGLLKPTSGRVSIGGVSPGDLGWNEMLSEVGYLPQELDMSPGMRVADFLSWMAWLKAVPGPVIDDNVSSVLRAVGLEELIDARVRVLSGGMKRRLGIAQALLSEPSLLILDEPTSGLDPLQRAEFRDLITMAAATSTVLLSTHIAEDVIAMCTEVVIVVAGRIRSRETIEAINHRAGQLSVSPAHMLEQMLREHVEAGEE